MNNTNNIVTTDFLILKEVNNGKYTVHYRFNGKELGKFLRDIDGYFYFKINSGHGYWGANTLRNIADALDLINKPWDDQVKNDLKK